MTNCMMADPPATTKAPLTHAYTPHTPAFLQDFASRFVAGEVGLTHRRRTLVQIAHRPTGLQARNQVLVSACCHARCAPHTRSPAFSLPASAVLAICSLGKKASTLQGVLSFFGPSFRFGVNASFLHLTVRHCR